MDNYIGSADNKHNLTEYTLSTGKIATLTDAEPEVKK